MPGYSVPLILGSGFFLVGMLSHEGMLALIPAFSYCLWGVGGRRNLAAKLAIIGSLVASGLLIARDTLEKTGPTLDPALICTPLIERSVHPNLCEGAIYYQRYPLEYWQGRIRKNLYQSDFKVTIAIYLFNCLFLILLLSQYQSHKKTVRSLVLSAIPIFPLYFVAIDYGRWMSLHITSFVFMTYSRPRQLPAAYPSQLPSRLLIPIIGASVLLSPGTITGVSRGALLRSIESASWRISQFLKNHQ